MWYVDWHLTGILPPPTVVLARPWCCMYDASNENYDMSSANNATKKQKQQKRHTPNLFYPRSLLLLIPMRAPTTIIICRFWSIRSIVIYYCFPIVTCKQITTTFYNFCWRSPPPPRTTLHQYILVATSFSRIHSNSSKFHIAAAFCYFPVFRTSVIQFYIGAS